MKNLSRWNVTYVYRTSGKDPLYLYACEELSLSLHSSSLNNENNITIMILSDACVR